MPLHAALADWARPLLSPANDWYAWRHINPRSLPAGVTLPEGNAYAQNEALKLQLRAAYAAGDDDRKLELTRYYIAVWGGVRRNSAGKLRGYALAAPEELVALGCRGIASWSKALCVRDPDRYAIYDARVAVALNALQLLQGTEAPQQYPLLVGQNRRINEGSLALAIHAHEAGWAELDEDVFYADYNAQVAAAAHALGVRHYTVEMLLFAQAPELLSAVLASDRLLAQGASPAL